MGGTLTVTSTVGSGSTFRAVLPFVVGETAIPSVDLGDLAGRRVLLVDDNATNRRVLQAMVTGWGCTATNAAGAAEALVLLNQMVDESRSIWT